MTNLILKENRSKFQFFPYHLVSTSPWPAVLKVLKWVKLSNSGNLLKLMIPSYIRKIISGWSNYSCMVTSHKISEKLMDNRGSKSNIKIVKEQRVDGSWFLLIRSLRCTLMTSEMKYRINIPSKQFKFKTFSTLNLNPDLNSWFVTGMVNLIFIFLSLKNEEVKLGWQVQGRFKISLHLRDKDLLLKIQDFFGGIGNINICLKKT